MHRRISPPTRMSPVRRNTRSQGILLLLITTAVYQPCTAVLNTAVSFMMQSSSGAMDGDGGDVQKTLPRLRRCSVCAAWRRLYRAPPPDPSRHRSVASQPRPTHLFSVTPPKEWCPMPSSASGGWRKAPSRGRLALSPRKGWARGKGLLIGVHSTFAGLSHPGSPVLTLTLNSR